MGLFVTALLRLTIHPYHTVHQFEIQFNGFPIFRVVETSPQLILEQLPTPFRKKPYPL